MKRMSHVVLAGNPKDAVKYGLTLVAECGLIWVPVTFARPDKFPPCPECHSDRHHRLPIEPTWVYRYYDQSGRLIYVGCSSSPKQRVEQHRINTWWFDQVVKMRFTVFPNRGYALEMEQRAIAAENPRWNIRHRDRSAWDIEDYRDFYYAISRNGATAKRLDRVNGEAMQKYGVDLSDMAGTTA